MMQAQQKVNPKVGTTNNQSASPFFNKLPPELRRLVYIECLFVGEVVVYAKSTTNPTRPQVSLLRSCKTLKLEAEPVLYENTLVLKKEEDIQNFFRNNLQIPARKLWPKCVEVSLGRDDFTQHDECMAYNHGVAKARGILAFSRSMIQYNRQVHRLAKQKLRDVTWQRKVNPILDHLTLDRLVLDLSNSLCQGACNCRMAAMAIVCFKKGFALQGPKVVEVRGWVLGSLDIDAVLGECLKTWTTRRAGEVAGNADSGLGTISEAEKLIMEVACEEEETP